VRNVRVEATVRNEPDEMETAGCVLGVQEALDDGQILVELAPFDRHVGSDDILPDNSAGSDVQMSGNQSDICKQDS
jgi:hypothetical protein